MDDLFAASRPRRILAEGAVWLPGFVRDQTDALLEAVQDVARVAPFRHLRTPGGRRMSVATTSCGACGWYSDARGYRYVSNDPLSGAPWPEMPALFLRVARDAAQVAGYEAFLPQSCLINRYEAGSGMGRHQDRDEGNPDAPIVSVSLGASARFDFGGIRKSDPVQRLELLDGDVVVWGGPSRMAWHGIMPLRETLRSRTGVLRYNLTFRAINSRVFPS